MSVTAPARGDVPAAELWNAESVFATPEAWETAFVQVQAQLGEAAAYTGEVAVIDIGVPRRLLEPFLVADEA